MYVISYKIHEYYQNGGDDYGGVHTNSGIPNKVFYLLVEGGEHYGINIDPLDQDWESSLAIAAEIIFIWNKNAIYIASKIIKTNCIVICISKCYLKYLLII